jgi:coproporphyrinogen III oxidase-like Fe-S oxidoreductase
MPLSTLWESICRLSGEDGTSPVELMEAVGKSAVPEIVARVEVKRMVEDGLLDTEGDTLQLTERGRKSCFERNRIATDGAIIAPD